jgi:uncharacterized protein YcgL (UPF0745 family)
MAPYSCSNVTTGAPLKGFLLNLLWTVTELFVLSFQSKNFKDSFTYVNNTKPYSALREILNDLGKHVYVMLFMLKENQK